MASRDDLNKALAAEYARFKAEKPSTTFETGYRGKYENPTEEVQRSDFEAAVADFAVRVHSDYGPICSVHSAATIASRAQGTWSIYIDKRGVPRPLFDFRIIVT